MPELPEVETIKNDLRKVILGKKITGVNVQKKKIVKNNLSNFKKALIKNSIEDIERIGKLLMFVIRRATTLQFGGQSKGAHANKFNNENKKYLLIHLKMTGQLIYLSHSQPSNLAGRPLPSYRSSGVNKEREKNTIVGGHEVPGMDYKLPNKYSHVIFKFSDKSVLYFNDMRQFGYLKIVDDNELRKIKEKYGIEPLTANYTLEKFKKIFKKRRISVKAVLLNQNLVAGIGNIYADEILFKALVKPARVARYLKNNEIKNIFKASEEILKKAIQYRGTTFSDYVDPRGRKGNFTKLLKVYGREGKKCYRCNGVVKKIKLAGRGTRYCPKCQL